MCNKACDKNSGTRKKKKKVTLSVSICAAPKDAKHLLASTKDDLFQNHAQ